MACFGTNGKLRLADATPDRGLLEKRMFIKDQIVKKSGSRRNPRARLRSPSGRSPESQIHKLRQPPSPIRRRRRRRRPPPRPSISLPPSPYGFHFEGPPDARTSRPARTSRAARSPTSTSVVSSSRTSGSTGGALSSPVLDLFPSPHRESLAGPIPALSQACCMCIRFNSIDA